MCQRRGTTLQNVECVDITAVFRYKCRTLLVLVEQSTRTVRQVALRCVALRYSHGIIGNALHGVHSHRTTV